MRYLELLIRITHTYHFGGSSRFCQLGQGVDKALAILEADFRGIAFPSSDE